MCGSERTVVRGAFVGRVLKRRKDRKRKRLRGSLYRGLQKVK